jgi:hypothetical protein
MEIHNKNILSRSTKRAKEKKTKEHAEEILVLAGKNVWHK